MYKKYSRTLEHYLERNSIADVLNTAKTAKYEGATNGGEWSMPCVVCGGDDRLRVWPKHPCGKGMAWCRQCERSGDALRWAMWRDGCDPDRKGETMKYLRSQSRTTSH